MAKFTQKQIDYLQDVITFNKHTATPAIHHVKTDITGNVTGYIIGNVGGDIGGSAYNIFGDVQNVKGNVKQSVYGDVGYSVKGSIGTTK